jgi:hypothetical protein
MASVASATHQGADVIAATLGRLSQQGAVVHRHAAITPAKARDTSSCDVDF